MPVRMTGMISGLDTDTLIQSMIEAQKIKNKSVEDKSTLLTWKEDRWKELNTKLVKLYKEDLNKMRLQGNYLTKAVSTSNDDYADIKGLTNAPIGSHKLQVESLASSQYVTSGIINLADGETKVTANTKLTELVDSPDLGVPKLEVGTLINITSNGKKKTFEVKADSTINDFVNFAKGAGLSANFDANHGRLYLSAKNSGEANAFGITATISTATEPKNQVLEAVGYSFLTADEKKIVDTALNELKSLDALEIQEGEKVEDLLNDPENAELKAVVDKIKVLAEKEAIRKIHIDIDVDIIAETEPVAKAAEENKIRDEVMKQEILLLKEEARKALKTQEEIDAITELTLSPEQLEDITGKQNEKVAASDTRIQKAVKKAATDAIAAEKALENNRYMVAEGVRESEIITAGNTAVDTAIIYQTKSKEIETDVYSRLRCLGLDALDETGTLKVDPDANPDDKALSIVVAATDSKITYNDVEYTGSTNAFNVNGLEISLKKISGDETLNLNVTNNTQGVYDMVKKFVTSYNEILAEMNELYYAPSARGYDPLSTDDKNQMTEKEIDLWEDKIKDSVLRNDSALGSLLSSMKGAMMTSVSVDGKKYSLSSFGIQTSKNYKENGLLHIFGDEEDAEYGARADKLLKALGENPDTVMEVLSKVSQNLYDTMYDKMKPIINVRSMFTFYNDKTMSKQQTDYAKRIAQLEAKLVETEDKYYKQFAAMETAMARLQSQSNALAGMLGTSNQK